MSSLGLRQPLAWRVLVVSRRRTRLGTATPPRSRVSVGCGRDLRSCDSGVAGRLGGVLSLGALLAAGGAGGYVVAGGVGPAELPQTVAAFHSLVGIAAVATAVGEFLAHAEELGIGGGVAAVLAARRGRRDLQWFDRRVRQARGTDVVVAARQERPD